LDKEAAELEEGTDKELFTLIYRSRAAKMQPIDLNSVRKQIASVKRQSAYYR
jgi:ribosomal protein L29